MRNPFNFPFTFRILLCLALVCALFPPSLTTFGQKRSGSSQRSAGQKTAQAGQSQRGGNQRGSTQAGQSRQKPGVTSDIPVDDSGTGSGAQGQRAIPKGGQRNVVSGNKQTTSDTSGTEPTADGEATTDAATTSTPARPTRTGTRPVPSSNVTAGAATGLAGAYIATTTGKSAGRASGAADAFIRGSKSGQSSGQLAETALHIQIDRFLSEAEASELESASQSGRLPKVLTNMNCGSVKIGNSAKPITINAAVAAQSAQGNVIYLLSAQPFSQQGAQGRGAAAGAVGFIEMRLNSSGAGKGSMYTSTQVGFNNGAVIVRGGASTATQLKVSRP